MLRDDLLINVAGALGQLYRCGDVKRVLGDEGWDASNVCPESTEGSDGLLIRQFLDVQCFCGATQRAPQAIQRQLTLGEGFAARLKVAERVQHYLLHGGSAV